MVILENIENRPTRVGGGRNSTFKPWSSANPEVVPLVGQTQAEAKIQAPEPLEVPKLPKDGLICTGLYLISRYKDLPIQYQQLVMKAASQGISMEEQLVRLPDKIRSLRDPLSMYHTTIQNGAQYEHYHNTGFESSDLITHIIEPENLAKFTSNQIVKLMRILDEDQNSEPTFINVAASRLDQVLTLQLAQVPIEKKATHIDTFNEDVARLLHTMPEILIYLKPEDRARIFEKYDVNVAIQRKKKLENRYLARFPTAVNGPAYSTFNNAWKEIKKIVDYLHTEVFASTADNDIFLEMQIEKLLPDLSDQTTTFKAQYLNIAIQSLLNAQNSSQDNNVYRKALYTVIQQLIRKIPIAYPLIDAPLTLLPDTKTRRIPTPAELGISEANTDDIAETQEFEPIDLSERNVEEYLAHPNQLLELDIKERETLINEMFVLISTPEGLEKIKNVKLKATQNIEEVGSKSTIEKINEIIQTPSFGRQAIMTMLTKLINVKPENLSTELPRVLGELSLTLPEEKMIDVDSTHPTDFYWITRELLEMIINAQDVAQSGASQTESEKKLAQLAQQVFTHLFTSTPAGMLTTTETLKAIKADGN